MLVLGGVSSGAPLADALGMGIGTEELLLAMLSGAEEVAGGLELDALVSGVPSLELAIDGSGATVGCGVAVLATGA
jgi:hypothetical protein